MNVLLLQHGEGYAELRPILSELHPLWGADFAKIGDPSYRRIRVQNKTPGHAQGLDRMGSQRIGNPSAGEGAASYWPGKEYGIRRPDPCETPLSWEEVNHFRNFGAKA